MPHSGALAKELSIASAMCLPLRGGGESESVALISGCGSSCCSLGGSYDRDRDGNGNDGHDHGSGHESECGHVCGFYGCGRGRGDRVCVHDDDGHAHDRDRDRDRDNDQRVGQNVAPS